jgi:hypothetical protein
LWLARRARLGTGARAAKDGGGHASQRQHGQRDRQYTALGGMEFDRWHVSSLESKLIKRIEKIKRISAIDRRYESGDSKTST